MNNNNNNDGDEGKKQAGVKAVPCAHIYQNNALHAALPLGPKSWDNFVAVLDASLGDHRPAAVPIWRKAWRVVTAPVRAIV